MTKTTALTVQKWTHFWDMHSGGHTKVVIDGREVNHIFIEAPKREAMSVFKSRFGRDANHITCDCCGGDYSISEYDTLQQASAYQRNCAYVDKEWIEERDRSTDKYVIQTIGRWMKDPKDRVVLDKRTQDLYRLATNKGATDGERRNATDKLVAIDKWPGLWHKPDFVPIEEFEKTGRMAKMGEKTKAMIIRAADIKPDERTRHHFDEDVW